MTPITKDLAISLPTGTVFHEAHGEGKGVKVIRWRKSGQVKTWKTRPDEWRMPVKHGLYDNDYVDQYTTGLHLESECEY